MSETKKPKPIRVMAVDDHQAWVGYIELIVNEIDDMEYVGSARDPDRALLVARSYSPDLAFIDIHFGSMADTRGLSLIRTMREESPGTALIVLTVDEGDEVLSEALDADVAGYMRKDDVIEPEDVIEAIRQVAAGNSYFRQRDVRRMAEIRRRVREHVDPCGELGLTPRQTEVLILLAEGLTNKEIAERLVISEKTAKNHVAAVLQTLRVNNRTRAAAIARDSGLITGIKRERVPDE
jgi:DNA-binding NarL/FixJ family response regulator